MKKFWIVLAALCLMLTGILSVSAADAVIYGDVNDDGRVNNRDLGLLQQYLNDMDVELNLDAADVYNDGKVNNRDLGLLQQFLNDWNVTLGPDEPTPPADDDNVFNDVELDWT